MTTTKEQEIRSLISKANNSNELAKNINKYLNSRELFIIEKVFGTLDRNCDSYSRTASTLTQMRAEILNG
jgi:hypothetical protein